MFGEESSRDATYLRFWTSVSKIYHIESLVDPCQLPWPSPKSFGSLWMSSGLELGLLTSQTVLPILQNPRSTLFIPMISSKHLLGSLVELDVRRLHLRIHVPRMISSNIEYRRSLVFAQVANPIVNWKNLNPFISMLTSVSSPQQHPFTCTILVLSTTHQAKPKSHLPMSNRIHALCGVLNLLGKGHQVRENPPVLLRFDCYPWLVMDLVPLVWFDVTTLKYYGLMPCYSTFASDDFKQIFFSAIFNTRTVFYRCVSWCDQFFLTLRFGC
ncbi:PREDICTED: uncharacterized protein LOC104779534 [Camelina sativa]|uniref:Uncharacterized protein LOC104779534 n=1 Tax=Camelina sativa TaxID=90675 RepID=A0ABM0YK20_CAMSA|nr:PREDICTED: uncharacterized protein LOC104779534 [Camelina sativa]